MVGEEQLQSRMRSEMFRSSVFHVSHDHMYSYKLGLGRVKLPLLWAVITVTKGDAIYRDRHLIVPGLSGNYDTDYQRPRRNNWCKL